MKITQELVKKLFLYIPITGSFTWRVDRSRGVKVGDIAGTINTSGYLITAINSDKYLCHRLIWLYMTGDWPDQTDHLDHDRLNNKWNNLRSVTKSGNSRNLSLFKNNKSGITGVRFKKQVNRWRATIWINGKGKALIQTNDFFEACCRRKAAEHKYGFHKNHGLSAN